MTGSRQLDLAEMKRVTGGEKSIMEQIEEHSPGGVWVGNRYYPRGLPIPAPGPVVT